MMPKHERAIIILCAGVQTGYPSYLYKQMLIVDKGIPLIERTVKQCRSLAGIEPYVVVRENEPFGLHYRYFYPAEYKHIVDTLASTDSLWKDLEDRLREWTRQHGGIVLVSPIDIVISEYDVVQPDLVFFAPAHAQLVKLDAPIRAIPDLVVEVLSPSTASTDRGKKLQLFARSGLPEYWLVDPALRSVEINVLRSGVFALAGRHATGERITSSAAPRFTCLVVAVFETPLPAG